MGTLQNPLRTHRPYVAKKIAQQSQKAAQGDRLTLAENHDIVCMWRSITNLIRNKDFRQPMTLRFHLELLGRFLGELGRDTWQDVCVYDAEPPPDPRHARLLVEVVEGYCHRLEYAAGRAVDSSPKASDGPSDAAAAATESAENLFLAGALAVHRGWPFAGLHGGSVFWERSHLVRILNMCLDKWAVSGQRDISVEDVESGDAGYVARSRGRHLPPTRSPALAGELLLFRDRPRAGSSINWILYELIYICLDVALIERWLAMQDPRHEMPEFEALLLLHALIRMTERYAHVSPGAMREAVNLLEARDVGSLGTMWSTGMQTAEMPASSRPQNITQ